MLHVPVEKESLGAMKKMKLTRSLLAACSIVALSAVMYGCVHDGGDDTATDETDVMEPMEPEPTPAETAQADAMQAATDAQTAADNAKASADAADMARENAATMQTGEMSSGLAMKARVAAGMAQTKADEAEAASEAAAAATDPIAIGRALVMAENALKAARDHEKDAGTYGQMAEAAADGELMIDGTMKSVGGTSLDAKAPNKTVTTIADGKSTTENTGFQAILVEEATGDAAGRAYAAADTATDPATAEMTYRQAVAARDITIGMTVDSDDDSARLAIIDSYVGSKTVKVFAYAEADQPVTSTTDGRTSARSGMIQTDGADTPADATDDTFASLRSLGMYYLAGAAADTNGLSEEDVVGDTAKGVAVYSYVNDQGNEDPTDDVTVHLVEDSSRTDGGTTTTVYRLVDVIVDASRRDGPDDDAADAGQVTAVIPEATKYEHIHFGVWSALEDGTDIDGLGIGFVQNFAGAATEASDMPNHGSATYDGNWVATIQAADPDGNGAVTLEDGVASLMADFGDGEITATLTSLATLSGDISGNTFSGEGLSDIEHGSLSSDDEDYEGSVSGGFFGTGAAEAGGVFSFTSDDMEEGGFSGAFGGAR